MLIVAAVAFTTASEAADITGAGSTFPFPVYYQWAQAYKKETGIGLAYESVGSGGGIRQIRARTVTFGATDKPLTREELKQVGLVQFPMILGGVVPVVNIPGIAAGQLVLDGPTLAAIYLGDITTWDDDRIQKLNPTLRLPFMRIVPFFRADGSGLNLVFTSYLASASARFRASIGADMSVHWPVGIGAKGCEGIEGGISQTPGAIGYVEYSYVEASHRVYANLINRAGHIVAPGIGSVQAAAASADWAHAPGLGLILTDQPGERSWPITMASFIVMSAAPSDRVATGQALGLFSWAYRHGAAMATELGYVPLPEVVIRAVRASWSAQIQR